MRISMGRGSRKQKRLAANRGRGGSRGGKGGRDRMRRKKLTKSKRREEANSEEREANVEEIMRGL